jgi:hypothetical protein
MLIILGWQLGCLSLFATKKLDLLTGFNVDRIAPFAVHMATGMDKFGSKKPCVLDIGNGQFFSLTPTQIVADERHQDVDHDLLGAV